MDGLSVFFCIVTFCAISFFLQGQKQWVRIIAAAVIPIFLFGILTYLEMIAVFVITSIMVFIPNIIMALIYFGIFCFVNKNNIDWWIYPIALILSFPFASFSSAINNLFFAPIMASIMTITKKDEKHDISRTTNLMHNDFRENKEEAFNVRYNHETSKENKNVTIDFSPIPILDKEYKEWKKLKEIETYATLSKDIQPVPVLLPPAPSIELIDLLWICSQRQEGTTFYENIATSKNASSKISWITEITKVNSNIRTGKFNLSMIKADKLIESTITTHDSDIENHAEKVIISVRRSPYSLNSELFGEWIRMDIGTYLTTKGVPFKIVIEKGGLSYGVQLITVNFDSNNVLWLIYLWSCGANGRIGDIEFILYCSFELAKQDDIWFKIN